MKPDEIVIVAAKRTPHGSLLGQLSPVCAPELGAVAHKGAIAQAGIDPSEIDEVISGCVLQAGIGQAPARQAAISAGIPNSVPATTVNKMCGSGMRTVMLAHDLIKAGSANIVLAGGMESMSNAPYLIPKARSGYRLGHGTLVDHLFFDGLEDAYERGKLMGYFADKSAQHFKISREQQDAFAERSMTLALNTQKENGFQTEIVPVTVNGRLESIEVTQDEGPAIEKLAKIPRLKPSFQENGTITPANSSSISDGAASLILMTLKEALNRGLTPLAKITAHAAFAGAPEWFTTAPIEAILKVLHKAAWTLDQVDLFEINEAFAIVPMLAINQLELDLQKVNIHGGACALGHPIGASGARILVTLIYALRSLKKRRGIAALCIGGGEATAIAIEVIYA